MQSFKHILKIAFLAVCCIIAITACQKSSGKSTDNNVLKVGTIAGPDTQLMEVAKQVASKII